MDRNQGAYYRSPTQLKVRSADHPLELVYRERPIHWGMYEVLSSALLIMLSLMFVAGIAALVLHIAGIDSLTQLYGFDQMIGHLEV